MAVTRPASSDAAATPAARELSVLRLCSVFEPPGDLALDGASSFDPIGGMQNHTAELTRNLDRLGVLQTVVTTRPPGAPARHRVGERAEVIRLGWPIHRFRQLYSVPALPAVLGAARGADVVHAHIGEDLAIVPLAAAAAARARAPVVLTIHSSLRYTFRGDGPRARVLTTLGATLEALGTRRAAAVIVLTERLRDLLAPQLPPGRVHVIPPGGNPELFRGPFPDPLPELPHPRVVFIGRLASQKAVERLVRAAPLLDPAARIVLVGDGPERHRIEREAEALGVRDRLVITGFVHHDRVPAHLAHADVVVLPSRYEELGSVLIEAMFMATPAVANDGPGPASVIRHGENGLLCDAGDPRGLAGAIRSVLDDPGLRRRLADGARATARRYEWPRLAAEILDVYREVVGARRRATA